MDPPAERDSSHASYFTRADKSPSSSGSLDPSENDPVNWSGAQVCTEILCTTQIIADVSCQTVLFITFLHSICARFTPDSD